MRSKGFSSVELLITLFIGAAFILAGYQLFLSVMNRGVHSRTHAVTSMAAFTEVKRFLNNAEYDPVIECDSLPGPASYYHPYGGYSIAYVRTYSCPSSVSLPELRKITIKGTLDGISATHSAYYRQP